jgi:Flp pilus assembly protein TadG
MMMMRSQTALRRGGATTVEMAAVLSVLVLFLFSVFEYGRYVMIENVLINAAREGCRYALVNCQSATVVSDTQAVVIQKMAGLDSQLTGFTVQAFPTNNPSSSLSTTNPDDPITVSATGTLRALFPALPFIPSSFSMTTATVMVCEGN